MCYSPWELQSGSRYFPFPSMQMPIHPFDKKKDKNEEKKTSVGKSIYAASVLVLLLLLLLMQIVADAIATSELE